MKKLRKNIKTPVICVFVVMGIISCIYMNREKEKSSRTEVSIAVWQDDLVQNYETNYFTKWLEEKTGYDIEFEYISEGYEKEYLNAMLTAGKGRIDAVFLPKGKELLTKEEFGNYVENGLVADLTEYMKEDSNLYRILKQYDTVTMREQLTSKDGIYYMPNLDTSRKSQIMQVLWMNIGWLKKLSLQIPEAVDDLEKVLKAFRDGDPNGNGRSDELPLISCESSYELQSYNYLLNAFIYNDPYHMRMYEGFDGELHSAAIQPEFREGLKYCSNLYQENLLSDACVSFTKRQLQEMIDAPEDIVGAFTSQSIADVIYPNCPDILARYIQVPPLKGYHGEQNAVMVEPELEIGGYIPANSEHKKEAFEIMDWMLSTEASLLASFGEEGKDWKPSDNGDLSTYGGKAKITTLHYLKDTVQNKNFAGAGPMILPPEYANGVTWNGDNSLVEYIDTRAVMLYENFYHSNIHRVSDKADGNVQTFTDDWISQFIYGRKDIQSDDVWKGYISERDKLYEK